MSTKEEFLTQVKEVLANRSADEEMRPNIEVWPAEDDFAHWVAHHESKERTVICNTPEFHDTPFCGTGYH